MYLFVSLLGEKLSKQQLQHSNIIKKLRVKEKESDTKTIKHQKKIREQEEELRQLQQVRIQSSFSNGHIQTELSLRTSWSIVWLVFKGISYATLFEINEPKESPSGLKDIVCELKPKYLRRCYCLQHSQQQHVKPVDVTQWRLQ